MGYLYVGLDDGFQRRLRLREPPREQPQDECDDAQASRRNQLKYELTSEERHRSRRRRESARRHAKARQQPRHQREAIQDHEQQEDRPMRDREIREVRAEPRFSNEWQSRTWP